MSLVSVSNYCCLLLFAAGFCCCLLLFSAVCSYLLLFASQHESKMAQKASQPPQNGPRNSPGVLKCPPGASKSPPRSVKIRPRGVPGCLQTPLRPASLKKIAIVGPFLSILGLQNYKKSDEISMLFHTCVQRLFSSLYELENVEHVIDETTCSFT